MKRTALVTGANRGIGFELCRQLRDVGHKVWLSARNPEAGMAAADELGVQFVRLDLADPGSIREARSVVGPVDILINNGAILESGDLLSVTGDAIERSVRINLEGAIHCIRAWAPDMVSQGWGRIVNVSSGWGSFDDGLGGPMAYSVTKAALNALTVSAARTLPPEVKCNAICPGWVQTDMGGAGASRTVERGAASVLWGATLPDFGPTGGFFRDGRRIAW
ncbi:MAG: SDR family NAD(P)-dependent oxidoreductase [Rhodothermales bacterium]|nr:SDR family NAD(P)-dependent oxidoreductase [Rhodothermales bacterium]MBO6780056.1 SDR family NAD(P)-dependent oxidoreductase [Rhodothermales bacterium]